MNQLDMFGEKLAVLVSEGWKVLRVTSKGHYYLLAKGNCRKGHYFSIDNGERNVHGYMA